MTLKDALFETYNRLLEQAQEDLIHALEIGDKLPSEMLSQIRSILGRHLKSHPLFEHSLVYARDLLTLMDNPSLDQMATKADQLINDRKRYNFSSSRSHFSNDASIGCSEKNFLQFQKSGFLICGK